MASTAERYGRSAVNREIDELRRLVDHTANPCGCKSGAVMVILGLVGWPVWRIASGAPGTVAGIAEALLAWVGVVVAAAVAGKLGGIAVGRWRHERLRRQLHRALTARGV
jgi:membrane associated rhomboid family serine protease